MQKDWLKAILSMQPDTYGKLGNQLAKMGFDQEDMETVNNDAIIMVALFRQAVKGDMKAIEYIDGSGVKSSPAAFWRFFRHAAPYILTNTYSIAQYIGHGLTKKSLKNRQTPF